jgi:hypothetical protein
LLKHQLCWKWRPMPGRLSTVCTNYAADDYHVILSSNVSYSHVSSQAVVCPTEATLTRRRLQVHLGSDVLLYYYYF